MTKNILIVGGTRGIGKCTSDLFLNSGWNVISVGRSELNMNSIWKVEHYLETFNESIALDAIVFSHGEWVSEPMPHTHLDEMYYRQYHSRVIAPIKIISHFANHLKMSSVGAVVFVSSTRGFIGGVNTAPYSLACAAQIALVQGFAREFSPVRFSCVCPGLTDTDMGKEVIRTGGAKATATPQNPISVAVEIHKLIEDKTKNGKIVRVVDDLASEAKWTW